MEYVESVVINMKKNKILLIVLIIFSFVLISCSNQEKNGKYTIISTSFPGYDFARAIVKDSDFEVKMLLKPGSEIHDYEPTPKDIIDIKNSDIFIYVGGESDSWIENILSDIDPDKTKIIRLMDLVDLVEEEFVEGMEDDTHSDAEWDEHVWTSPVKAITIINKLKEQIIKIDTDNKNLYESNSNLYIKELESIHNDILKVLENSKRKEIVFGDRFPLRYFTDEYGLSYVAAFSGCSEQSEASAKTISYLINKVKKDKIPVVFKIELSNGNIANTIAEETGSKVLEFHSIHNITSKDFEDGITYVDLMRRNIEALKEALN